MLASEKMFHAPIFDSSARIAQRTASHAPPDFAVRAHELRLHVLGHLHVAQVLHRELPLALRHGPQLGGVAEHVVQRHLGVDDHLRGKRVVSRAQKRGCAMRVL